MVIGIDRADFRNRFGEWFAPVYFVDGGFPMSLGVDLRFPQHVLKKMVSRAIRDLAWDVVSMNLVECCS